jgi:hypothetical protein
LSDREREGDGGYYYEDGDYYGDGEYDEELEEL